jgi:hypothetical protein
MKQTIKPQQPTMTNIPRALREETTHNREVLKHVDTNAALDSPEDTAALNSVIEQLKVGTAATILLNIKEISNNDLYAFLQSPLKAPYSAGNPAETPQNNSEDRTIKNALSRAVHGILSLKNLAGLGDSETFNIKNEIGKSLLETISLKTQLADIKDNIEKLYKTLSPIN